jgi:predicted lipoprotein
MSQQRRESSLSERSHRRARVGTFLAIALGVFGACTTEDPREYFRTATPNPLPGSGGGSATAGRSAGGRAGSAGSSGKSGAGAPASGGSSGSEGPSNLGGEAGEDAHGPNPGSGGHAGTTSSAGTQSAGSPGAGGTSGASGASGSSAASGSGGGPPSDACGERPVASEAFTKQALRAAASDCAIWHYCKFEAEAARVEQATAAHVAAPTPETLELARTSWRQAMAAWSAVELFQFGPLASAAESEGKDSVHGLGLREFIYSWPRFTRCRVEEQVASEKYATQGFANVPIASRGLYALEYLLFYEGSDTACASGSSTVNTWATLDSTTLTEHKHRYLTALTGDVLATTRQLIELWSPSGGNFRETFVNAGGYDDEQHALTILAWSLVYIEREVKDWKLGVPLGVTISHPVNGPEAPFSHDSTANIRGNLRGFRALFQGCGAAGEGLGFDDWLAEAGHAELGADIIHAIDAAEAFASTFPPLELATSEELETFYRTIKVLSDYLKSDLFGSGSPLNLKLPMGVAGDTD